MNDIICPECGHKIGQNSKPDGFVVYRYAYKLDQDDEANCIDINALRAERDAYKAALEKVKDIAGRHALLGRADDYAWITTIINAAMEKAGGKK